MTAQLPQSDGRHHGLLTLAEVAARFVRSERTVWRWIKVGKLPGIKLGGRWFVEESVVVAALAQSDKRDGES